MFTMISTLFLALVASSAITARVIPRMTPPATYDTADLESYDSYHCRYLALGCQSQHGTSFFDSCCHPLLASESISSLASECQTSAALACSNGDTGGSDDGDCNDEPSSTSTGSTPASTTSSSAGTPVNVAPAPQTPTSTSTSQKATSTSSSSNGGVNTGGYATYFYQDGNAGACGTVHSDSDYICAIDQARYGNSGDTSSLCGKQVRITNTNNGNQVTVTIADDCPTCDNANSIDLSVAAFQALGSLSEGLLPISWVFV